MGYNAEVYYVSKNAKIQPFEVPNVPEWYVFGGARIHEDGRIVLRDAYGKAYNSNQFAKLLSQHLKCGRIELEFIGDDGAKWGHVVYPGAVVDIEYTIVRKIAEIDGTLAPDAAADLTEIVTQEKGEVYEMFQDAIQKIKECTWTE